MNEFIKAVKEANEEIYLFLQNTPHEKLCEDVSLGFGGDMSHFMDIEAEKIFIKYLQNFGQIYSEEAGYVGEKNENVIIIDPIDGSDNFVSQIPYYGSSVALKKNEKVICGIICNFANKDIFVKDENSFKKGKLFEKDFIEVKNNDFSSVGIFEKSYSSQKFFNLLQEKNIKFRSCGALALSLAYASNVDFVVFEGEIREFDIAAGLFMCEDLYLKKTNNYLIVSKNKLFFDKISQK